MSDDFPTPVEFRAGIAIMIVILLAAGPVRWVIGEVTKPPLYLQLAAVMADRKELWFTPGVQRSDLGNVTNLVCPLADREHLDALAKERPDLVYRFRPNGATGTREGALVYHFTRHINLFNAQLLTIELWHSGQCYGHYQHVS